MKKKSPHLICGIVQFLTIQLQALLEISSLWKNWMSLDAKSLVINSKQLELILLLIAKTKTVE